MSDLDTTALIQAHLSVYYKGPNLSLMEAVEIGIERYLFVIEKQKEHENEGEDEKLLYSSEWDHGTKWDRRDAGYRVQLNSGTSSPSADNVRPLRPGTG